VPCTEAKRRQRCLQASGAAVVVALLAGCASQRAPAPAPAPTPTAATRPAAPAPAPLGGARNWDDYRVAAARRIVAANPQITHDGVVQQPSLAIPVLEVELNADGSIRNISVMREPSQARDTTRIAIDAVRRAAPFGDVSRLPKPWRFSEAFLFNDDRRFKPRTLDQ
jgi:protein TonB